MAIRQTLEVLKAMEADGIIERYAIAGAVAAYNYIEPTPTEDLDILVTFEAAKSSALLTLEPIFAYLKERGYGTHQKEGILIGDWRVQFLPVANDLDRDALTEARDIELDGQGEPAAKTRVLKAEHLVAIALRLGRPKDLIRIAQFLTESAVTIPALCSILSRHGLRDLWVSFCRRNRLADPCRFGTQ